MTRFVIVKWRRSGDAWPCASVFYGKYATVNAERRAADLEADETVAWVETG